MTKLTKEMQEGLYDPRVISNIWIIPKYQNKIEQLFKTLNPFEVNSFFESHQYRDYDEQTEENTQDHDITIIDELTYSVFIEHLPNYFNINDLKEAMYDPDIKAKAKEILKYTIDKLLDPAPKRCEPSICKALEAKDISCDTVDLKALIDSNLSCNENMKAILREVGARKTDKYQDAARKTTAYYAGTGKLRNASPQERAAAFAAMREAGTLRGYDTPQKRFEKECKAKAQTGKKLRGQQTLTSAVSTSRRLSDYEGDNMRANDMEIDPEEKKWIDEELPEYAKKLSYEDYKKRKKMHMRLNDPKKLEDYSDKDLKDLMNEPRLSLEEQKKRLKARLDKHYSDIEINYVKKGLLKTIHAPLFNGQLDLRGNRLTVNDNTTNSDLSKFLNKKVIAFKLYDPKQSAGIPKAWFSAMVLGIKKSSDVRNPYAIVNNIWARLPAHTQTDIRRRAAAGEHFKYDLPLPKDLATRGTGTLRIVKPFKLAEAQVNVNRKDMSAVKKSGIFRPMKRSDGTICQVARCKGVKPVNIFVDQVR